MQILIGFFIALAVGLTGIGGGSFTVPALVLISRLPPGMAVGTAFVFAAAMRLIAAPFYMMRNHVHARYLWLMLKGAIPGLLLGTYLLRIMGTGTWSPIVVIAIGAILAVSSSLTFVNRLQNPRFAQKNSRWIPRLALPIGVEAGFSSAGAGALGTVLLLNYSEMTAAQAVGTDLIFGLALAVIGSAFHSSWGTISSPALWQLLAGGVPGVLLGCALARRFPSRKLKMAIAVIAVFAGVQLVWSGARTLVTQHAANAAGSTPPAALAAGGVTSRVRR